MRCSPAFYPVPASGDVEAGCREYERLLREHPADLCVMGIGENGHIAFNDPPYADFDDPVWVKVVRLDDRSRRQQVGEGHFASLDEVPTHAVTLTIPALLAATRARARARATQGVGRGALAARPGDRRLPRLHPAEHRARAPVPGCQRGG